MNLLCSHEIQAIIPKNTITFIRNNGYNIRKEQQGRYSDMTIKEAAAAWGISERRVNDRSALRERLRKEVLSFSHPLFGIDSTVVTLHCHSICISVKIYQ